MTPTAIPTEAMTGAIVSAALILKAMVENHQWKKRKSGIEHHLDGQIAELRSDIETSSRLADERYNKLAYAVGVEGENGIRKEMGELRRRVTDVETSAIRRLEHEIEFRRRRDDSG